VGSNDTADITSLTGGLQVIASAIVVVESNDAPQCRARFVDRAIVVGRDPACELAVDDQGLSRRHFRVETAPEGWRVEDLGSSNGTVVNGTPISGAVVVADEAVVRAGRTVFLLQWHGARFANGAGVETIEGRVRGRDMRDVEREIERAAARGVPLLIVGETGTGKKHAAHLFHAAGPNSRGPFTEVNCSNIGGDTATAQLFGAKKGSHSTADRDTPGAFVEAHGGALFLDELHQLASDVQPKLLRTVETKRVQPLGTTQTRAVDVQICSATNVDLRARIDAGQFQADLFYRLRGAEVRLPPLRKRPEEIPFLIRLALATENVQLPVRHELVEACLLRAWPGNVRELIATVGAAARGAKDSKASRLQPKHLPPDPAPPALATPSVAPSSPTNSAIAALPKHRQLALQVFDAALTRHGGSVKAAAEEVGIETSTAYEWRDLLAGKPRRRR
jgi:DNA-binding NtrC family response regulator